MSANFTMVGKLKIPKSEKINLYEENQTRSGMGVSNVTKINLTSGSNTFMLEARGYLANKDEDRKVFSFSKREGDKKGEPLVFLYKDREKYRNQVAEFKKFTIKDKDNKREFLTEYDFAKELGSLMKEGYFNEKQVRVSGEIDYGHYIDKDGNDKYFKKYIPKRIYLLEEEEEPFAEATIEFYFDSDALFEKEPRVYNLECKINQYNSEFKMETLYPEFIELDFENKTDDAMNFMINKLGIDNIEIGKLNKLSLKVDMVNGAEKVDLTEDMLTDDEKDMLNFGFTTMADLRKEKGMGVGSFVSKFVMKGIGRGYSSGAKETDKTIEDFTPKADTMNSLIESMVDDMEDDVPF